MFCFSCSVVFSHPQLLFYLFFSLLTPLSYLESFLCLLFSLLSFSSILSLYFNRLSCLYLFLANVSLSPSFLPSFLSFSFIPRPITIYSYLSPFFPFFRILLLSILIFSSSLTSFSMSQGFLLTCA